MAYKNIEKRKERMKLYRLNNIEKIKKYQKEWVLNNKEKIKKNRKEYRLKNKQKSKEYWLKKAYGLTFKQYEDMIKNQNYKCFICTKEFNNMNPSLKACVDHDHETGQIRSILCKRCNSALGHCSENIITISNMKKYLYKYKTDEQIEKFGIIKPQKKLKQLEEKIKLIEKELIENYNI